MKKELVAASSVPLVLSLLGRGESYGYQIIQDLKEMSDGEVCWTDGMLYPVLHRLEKQKLLISRWDKKQTGRRRKYYRLSAAGQRALGQEKKDWLAVHQLLNDLWSPGAKEPGHA